MASFSCGSACRSYVKPNYRLYTQRFILLLPPLTLCINQENCRALIEKKLYEESSLTVG